MTNTATTSSTRRSATVCVNVRASPWKVAFIVGGTMRSAVSWMYCVTLPSGTPGLGVKPNVTLVNWLM